MTNFQIGDQVRVKTNVHADRGGGDDAFPSAKIVQFLKDVKGGIRLDRPLRGFHYWNVLDVQKTGSATSAKGQPKNED